MLFADIPQMIINDYFITSCSFIPALSITEYLKIISSAANALVAIALALKTLVETLKKSLKSKSSLLVTVLFLFTLAASSFSIYSACHWSFTKIPAIELGHKEDLNPVSALKDRSLMPLGKAVQEAKKAETLNFELCCSNPLVEPSDKIMREISNLWNSSAVKCQAVNIQLSSTFTSFSSSEAESVAFTYSITYLFMNATHIQWWHPERLDSIPFEIKITGVGGCKPEMIWRQNRTGALIAPTDAFPAGHLDRKALKNPIATSLAIIKQACGAEVKVQLLFKQNATAFVTLPMLTSLIKLRAPAAIGEGKFGTTTIFPSGYTVCIKFSKIGRQPSYVNNYGSLNVLHWGVSVLEWGSSRDRSFWSGSVHYARITAKVVCLIPPQTMLWLDHLRGKTNIIVEGVNVIHPPGIES